MTFEKFLREVYDMFCHDEKHWLAESFLDPKTHSHKPNKPTGRYDEERHGLTFYDSWSMGGDSGNCWDDTITGISAEVEPEDGPEFDEILLKFYPEIGVPLYNLMRKKVIVKGSYINGDYYGGSETTGYKGFNIETLYNEMSERGLFKED